MVVVEKEAFEQFQIADSRWYGSDFIIVEDEIFQLRLTMKKAFWQIFQKILAG